MSPEVEYYPQPPTQGKFLEPENPDTTFKASIAEAEKSGIPTVIAQIKYDYGRWLMSPETRRHTEAVPFFREAAKIQTSQGNKIEAANAYLRLSNCLSLTGDVDELKEAEEAVKKAIEFYPDPEDFTKPKATAIVRYIGILASLAHQTGNRDYFNQGMEVCKQYAEILKKSTRLWADLQSEGFTKIA